MKTAHAEVTSLVEQVGAKVGIPVSCMHAAVHEGTGCVHRRYVHTYIGATRLLAIQHACLAVAVLNI